MSKSIASPLRYPGGKSCLYDMVCALLRANGLQRGHYIEPYAGGCGLALSLLFQGQVSDIYINDIDVAIWSFWKAALDHTSELIARIAATPVTIEEWHRQRRIYEEQDLGDIVNLGFAAFFLNRTNRSGVIKGAGVIGGLAQDGAYKIDCRFNKEPLIRRIERIASYKDSIHLFNTDALDFMKEIDKEVPERSLFCIDPPYFSKGSSLYTNFYGCNEHENVASSVMMLSHPWIVTYDYHDEIRRIYSDRRQYMLSLNYSVQIKRVGAELLIASNELKVPSEILVTRDNEPLPRVLVSPPQAKPAALFKSFVSTLG